MNVDWFEMTHGGRSLGVHEVMNLLPHRYPFLLVDRIVEIRTPKPLHSGMTDKEILSLREGSTVHAIKNVTLNEPQFTGHFPGHPIFPGVLTIEALCQTALFVTAPFLAASNNGKVPKVEVALAGADGFRFRKPIVPGDQLHLKVRLNKVIGAIWSFEGTAEVDGKLVAEGEFIAHLSVLKG